MRQALADSLGGALRETVLYPRGTVIICTSCAKPIYKLERGIAAGEKGGRAVSAFRPVTVNDLLDLKWRAQGSGTEPGVIAALRGWTADQMRAHVQQLTVPKAGDDMACPVCGDVFVQARSASADDAADRAYVLELVTVPPRAA